MRYDDPSHLDAFRRGAYPRIHNALFDFILAHASGERACDLGCCYGLLAQRLAATGLWACMGIEANASYIAAAKVAGVTVPVHHLRVAQATLPDLAVLLGRYACDTLIARRALPELWGGNPDGGRCFADCLADAGVREVFLQGRVHTAHASNPLRQLSAEIALLQHRYELRVVTSHLAKLSLL